MVSGLARQWLGMHARLEPLASASIWPGDCDARAISDKNPTTPAVVMATRATRSALATAIVLERDALIFLEGLRTARS